MMIDISGMDRAWVLMRLYNAARPLGNGRLLDRLVRANRGEMMTIDDARALIAEREGRQMTIASRYYFDYVGGRPLKVNLEGPELDTWGYDRDQGGEGAAARALGKASE